MHRVAIAVGLAVVLAGSGAGLTGCGQESQPEGTAERAGKKLDEAMESAKEAAEEGVRKTAEAAEAAKEGIEEAAEDVKEAAGEMKEEVEEAVEGDSEPHEGAEHPQ
jgi:hyperosmotically inducible protein